MGDGVCRSDDTERGKRLTISLNWLLRGLLAVGGIVLLFVTWPVASGAWWAQKSDAVVTELRNGRPITEQDVVSALAALDRAVAADPVAGRRLQRSELLVGAALTLAPTLASQTRDNWLRRARADLRRGLADAPVRGMDWLRLAVVRQALDGPSRGVVAPLLMSIETAPMLSIAWAPRLRVILDNWGYLNDEQRTEVRRYVVKTWRHSVDRRWFGQMVRDPTDELILRFFLRNEPGAQEELSRWIRATRK